MTLEGRTILSRLAPPLDPLGCLRWKLAGPAAESLAFGVVRGIRGAKRQSLTRYGRRGISLAISKTPMRCSIPSGTRYGISSSIIGTP